MFLFPKLPRIAVDKRGPLQFKHSTKESQVMFAFFEEYLKLDSCNTPTIWNTILDRYHFPSALRQTFSVGIHLSFICYSSHLAFMFDFYFNRKYPGYQTLPKNKFSFLGESGTQGKSKTAICKTILQPIFGSGSDVMVLQTSILTIFLCTKAILHLQ